jgi:transposase
VITIRPDLKVLVAAQPVDFRKGMDALAGLVAERLSENPYAGTIFVFRSKRADRVKILAFDGTGLILATKRLEEGRFTWPPIQGGVVRLTAAQFAMLVDGLDWTRVSPRPVRRPLRVG